MEMISLRKIQGKLVKIKLETKYIQKESNPVITLIIGTIPVEEILNKTRTS